ncbi:MAG: LLM class F420-dependent oxidoreductase [Chloroflexi bacterium]|nr:LLM class F420-dependent oxidoreductase [Chloroflexota bacterium]
MKFGITLPHFRQVMSAQGVQQVAREAESLGYDSIWVTDHLVIPDAYVERFGEAMMEPLTVLASVIPITSRVKLGISVVIAPYRNPIFVAKSLATMDVLSEGRLIAGVASGWCREEFEYLGVSFQERGALTDEAIQLYKEIWTRDRPRFQGRYWQFADLEAKPQPVQKPHPPIWVGGNSPRGRRRAVELGDAWHPTRIRAPEIRQAWEHIRRLAERQGRDLKGFSIAPRHPMKLYDHSIGQPWPLLGTVDEVKVALEELSQAGAGYLVLDTFYSLKELEGESLDTMRRTLDTFARQVMPAFKDR